MPVKHIDAASLFPISSLYLHSMLGIGLMRYIPRCQSKPLHHRDTNTTKDSGDEVTSNSYIASPMESTNSSSLVHKSATESFSFTAHSFAAQRQLAWWSSSPVSTRSAGSFRHVRSFAHDIHAVVVVWSRSRDLAAGFRGSDTIAR
jgi:hypothetical protein